MILPSVTVWRDTLREAQEDNIPRLGAALSFYTALSLSPLLLLLVSLAGTLAGRESTSRQLLAQIRTLAGPSGEAVAESVLVAAKTESGGTLATIIGLITLAVGATGVFVELQSAMDTVWDVENEPRPGGVWGLVQSRLLSLALIAGMALLLIASLVLSSVLAACMGFLTSRFPGLAVLLSAGDLVLAVLLATVLFAMIFKLMPNARMAWSDVWTGAALTAVLFAAGKFAIGAYLGRAAIGSGYGAAGSFVALLVWAYYSAQILLLGAEFTEVYSRTHGSRCPASRQLPETEMNNRAAEGAQRGSSR